MKVYLTSAYTFHETKNFAVKWLTESAALDPFKIHSVTNIPQEADIILFVEHHPGEDPYFFKIFSSNIFKKYSKKCYLYHDCDWAVPLVPGVYPSIESRIYNEKIAQSGHYIARLCENDAIKYQPQNQETEFLFSFVGASKTHSSRTQILKLQHPKSFLKDTTGKNSWKLDPQEKINYEQEYVLICQKSQFVLCPRGMGPSTYRLYETMEMGKPPVIISDTWVPQKGPQWDDFSIRVPEDQIINIPNILEEKKSLGPKMGKLAREAWENWFSKEVSFHHIIESCERLHKERSNITNMEKFKIFKEFLMPFHSKNLLRYSKNTVRLKYKAMLNELLNQK